MRGWQESLADFLKSALAYLSLSELILLLPEQALEHVGFHAIGDMHDLRQIVAESRLETHVLP